MSGAYPLSDQERGFLRRETLKAMVQGSIPPAITMWFLLGGFPMALWGSNGFGAFQFKNSFGMAVLMTLLMSLGMRAGRARGRVPALGWTRTGQPLLRFIPRHLPLRVLAFALADMTIIGSLSFVVAVATGIDEIERLPFVLFMGGQCVVNAMVLAPLILIGAMTDPIPLKTKVTA